MPDQRYPIFGAQGPRDLRKHAFSVDSGFNQVSNVPTHAILGNENTVSGHSEHDTVAELDCDFAFSANADGLNDTGNHGQAHTSQPLFFNDNIIAASSATGARCARSSPKAIQQTAETRNSMKRPSQLSRTTSSPHIQRLGPVSQSSSRDRSADTMLQYQNLLSHYLRLQHDYKNLQGRHGRMSSRHNGSLQPPGSAIRADNNLLDGMGAPHLLQPLASSGPLDAFNGMTRSNTSNYNDLESRIADHEQENAYIMQRMQEFLEHVNAGLAEITEFLKKQHELPNNAFPRVQALQDLPEAPGPEDREQELSWSLEC